MEPSASPIVITLIGDSILDNKSYVRSKPSVFEQLTAKIASRPWKAYLRAIDGDVMSGIPKQLKKVPADTTHLVLSVGGNDALGLLASFNSRGDFWNPMKLYRTIQHIRTEFRRQYSAMLDNIMEQDKHLIVCNIYKPNFESGAHQMLSVIGLSFINGVIVDEVKKRGLPLIDISTIFDNAKDYANPIEPGVPGGDKITNNVIRILHEHDFSSKTHKVYSYKEYSAETVSQAKVQKKDSVVQPKEEAKPVEDKQEDKQEEDQQEEEVRAQMKENAVGDTTQNEPFRHM